MTRLVRLGCLFGSLVGACGGAEFTAAPGDASVDSPAVTVDAAPDTGHADAAPRVDGAAGDAASDADRADSGHADAAHGDAGHADAADGCAGNVYYFDNDGDGYGGTTAVTGCTPPPQGAWVTRGGDCDDSNSDVFPGQTTFFANGYVVTGTSRVSFDYDCDGQEVESGTSPKANCGPSALNCGGAGYLTATPARTGAGVDAYCGSTQSVTCSVVNLACTAGPPMSTSPITCH